MDVGAAAISVGPFRSRRCRYDLGDRAASRGLNLGPDQALPAEPLGLPLHAVREEGLNRAVA
jgi:hypothetical protein